MSSDPLSPYAEIDISTTDFGTLLSNLSVVEGIARYYRGRFRMPRIVLPSISIEPQTGKAGSRVAIYDSTFTNLVTVDVGGTDGRGNGYNGLDVASFPSNFNGSTWDRATYGGQVGNGTATGAASTSLIAAGGASKKFRIWGIAISAVSTAAATNGVVSVNEITSGLVLLSLRVSATSATVVSTSLQYQGMPQPTANNGIQVTSIANVTTDASIVVTTSAY